MRLRRLESAVGVPRAELDALVSAAGKSRVLLDQPFRAQPRHAYLTNQIASSAVATDATTLVAHDGDALVGLAVYREPAWDQEVLGIKTGRLEYIVARDSIVAAQLASGLDALVKERGIRMCSARVHSSDLGVIGALEATGYHYRETVLTPWLGLSSIQALESDEVRAAASADCDRLAQVARAAFRTDRFHLDPRIDRRAADAVYDRWVRDWFAAHRGNARETVIDVDGKPAGFILYDIVDAPEFERGPVAAIVLSAVDPELQGRGLGLTLWRGTMKRMQAEAAYVTTVMTASNTSVFGLYVKLGFSFSSNEVTLHRWLD